jgi:hypothetical protein
MAPSASLGRKTQRAEDVWTAQLVPSVSADTETEDATSRRAIQGIALRTHCLSIGTSPQGEHSPPLLGEVIVTYERKTRQAVVASRLALYTPAEECQVPNHRSPTGDGISFE